MNPASMMNPYAMAAQAGLGLVGGFLGARRAGQAAKQAGTTLANAYHQGAADTWEIPGYVNPAIDTAYSRAGEDVFGNAWNSAANIEARANQARGDVSGALAQGRTDLAGYLDPYATAGQGALTSLADLANAKAPTLEQLQMDPGYAWRMEQGTKALERTAAGRGLLQSGSFAKSLTNYAQGAASQEYANAFDRYMRGQEQRRNSLTTLAGLGSQAAQTAGTTLANLGLQGANAMGRFGMEGTQQAGDWTNAASVYKGNTGINSALQQAQNIVNAANQANQYNLNAAGATAGSQQALGNAWSQFYNNAGQSMSDLVGLNYGPQSGGGTWADTGYATGLPTTGGTRRRGR